MFVPTDTKDRISVDINLRKIVRRAFYIPSDKYSRCIPLYCKFTTLHVIEALCDTLIAKYKYTVQSGEDIK